MDLNKDSTVVVSQNQVSANLSTDGNGQFVILGLRDGVYFELNEVGARIWELIQRPRTIHSVVAVLIEEFAVPFDRCETDVISLVTEMIGRGLVESWDGPAP